MKLRKAKRQQAKIKAAIQGPSGSGKTYSSLLLAKGLAGSWSKVAIIDTENGSADLYDGLGDYNVITMDEPYSPEKYIEAIEACESAGMTVCILDSISHCWDFLLEYHDSLKGNSYTNWAKVTPRHKKFVEKILQSPIHIIATMRTKQDYVLNQKDGKYVPEKVGLKAIQRDGVDYEFTLVFDIDLNHQVVASKDRTKVFMDRPSFVITENTGLEILEWCNGKSIDDVIQLIDDANSVDELKKLYKEYPGFAKALEKKIKSRVEELKQLT